MTKKEKLMLACMAFLILFMLFAICSADLPSSADCPAPEDLESMEVYLNLKGSIHDNVTPEEAIESFARMCEIPVSCRDDQVLMEYSYSEYSDSFEVHLVRQFEFSDSLEYVQLHLCLDFPAGETKDYPRTSQWRDTGRTDIRKFLTESAGFQAVKGQTPSQASVFIDWTW